MRPQDTLHFSYQALRAYPGRTALILLAMCIGVAAIILLTSLGEGARLYVIGQFQGLGSNLLIVLPGRSETTGGAPPMLGTTPRDLTLDDALANTLRRLDPSTPDEVLAAAAFRLAVSCIQDGCPRWPTRMRWSTDCKPGPVSFTPR